MIALPPRLPLFPYTTLFRSDYFDAGLVWDQLGPYLTQVGISFDRFMDLGRQRPGDPRERLCTTYAALRLADQSECRVSRARSEEHTSELQSLTNLVCRLLLE